jgi:peptidyl-tRNA hydrolase, PTH1 family
MSKFTHLIVGLGNMGQQYQKTRHNVGMLCLDYMVEKHRSGPYKMKVSYGSHISVLRIISPTHEINALLLSPVTYMNIIGKNVAKAMKSERLEKTSLIVLHDDLE